MVKNKKQESDSWTDKLWHKIKTFGPIALLASCSLNVNANNNPPKSNNSSELTTKKAYPDYSTKNAKFPIKKKAYPGKYYNEICNGSPCWLASTYETRGAGINGNINSAGTWNDNGGYRGINQISPQHAQKFVNWLSDKKEYSAVYNLLKKGGVGKYNWQKTAKLYEDQMILSQEDYMTQVYNVDNFKTVQDIINQSNANINIKKLHPAIISCMHQLMVERPSWREKIANKIIRYAKANNGDENSLNSEKFIKLLVKERSADLADKAISLLQNDSINWKENQFDSLLSKAIPLHDEKITWFTLNFRPQKLEKIEISNKFKHAQFSIQQDNTRISIPTLPDIKQKKLRIISQIYSKRSNSR